MQACCVTVFFCSHCTTQLSTVSRVMSSPSNMCPSAICSCDNQHQMAMSRQQQLLLLLTHFCFLVKYAPCAVMHAAASVNNVFLPIGSQRTASVKAFAVHNRFYESCKAAMIMLQANMKLLLTNTELREKVKAAEKVCENVPAFACCKREFRQQCPCTAN